MLEQSKIGKVSPMKISFATDVRLKRVAKRLKKCAAERGIELKLSDCLKAMAKVYGYRNYSDFYCQLGQKPPTLWDDCVPPEEVRDRERFQIATLADDLQIEKEVAASIVAEIGPTGRGHSGDTPIKNEEDTTNVTVVQKKRSGSGIAGGKYKVYDLTRR